MLTRRAAINIGLAAALGSAVPLRSRAQTSMRELATSDSGSLMLIEGSGCNVVTLAGAEAALVIDGGLREHANSLHEAILQTTGNDRIGTLINTHWHPEQIGINELAAGDGAQIIAHETTARFLASPVYSSLFEGRRPALPEAARPTRLLRSEGSIGGAGIQIDFGYLPAAHTDGDIFLHLPAFNVLIAGGVVSADTWPLLDHRNGAWYGGRVRALEHLAERVRPDTLVVPAQGGLLSGSDIVRQRDMYQSLFETLIEHMNLGLGPEDVVARRPLANHETEFGDASAFLDGAYRSMLIAYVPD